MLCFNFSIRQIPTIRLVKHSGFQKRLAKKIHLAFHLLVSYYLSYCLQWLKCTKNWTKFASGFHETEHACGAKRWGLCERRCKSVPWRYYSCSCTINFCPLHSPVLWHILTSKYLITLYLSVQRLQLSRATVMFLSWHRLISPSRYCTIIVQLTHSSSIFALIWNHSLHFRRYSRLETSSLNIPQSMAKLATCKSILRAAGSRPCRILTPCVPVEYSRSTIFVCSWFWNLKRMIGWKIPYLQKGRL